MPPRIATANALMPNSVPMSECTLNSGAISSPARPASAVESANETAIASRTLMPISRAASLFCTTASSALPSRVWWKASCSASAMPSPTTGMTSCSG